MMYVRVWNRRLGVPPCVYVNACARCTCSGLETYAAHRAERDKAAAHMCYFTRRREQGVDRLPPETKDALQHRVDPNVQQAERRAVEALLYTAGSKYPGQKASMALFKDKVVTVNKWVSIQVHQ